MICEECKSPTNNPRFCGHSCSTKHQNRTQHWRNISGKNKKFHPCNACLKPCELRRTFCSGKCHKQFLYDRIINTWKKTGEIGKSTLYTYLFKKQNGCCSSCGINDWNNKPIRLEIEHVDGNSGNNFENNVCLICPNCHSQTPTFKGRNKGNGRHARRMRYQEGKSY